MNIVAPILAAGDYEFTAQATADPVDPDLDNNGGTFILDRRSKGGTCSQSPHAGFDPLLPALVILSLLAIGWRRRHGRRQA